MKKIIFIKINAYFPELKWLYSKEFVDNSELNSLLLNRWEIKNIKKIDFNNQKSEYLIQVQLENSNQVKMKNLFFNNKIFKK